MKNMISFQARCHILKETDDLRSAQKFFKPQKPTQILINHALNKKPCASLFLIKH